MLLSYYVAALAVVIGIGGILLSGIAIVVDAVFDTSLTDYFDEEFIYYGMIATVVTTALFLVVNFIELTLHLIS